VYVLITTQLSYPLTFFCLDSGVHHRRVGGIVGWGRETSGCLCDAFEISMVSANEMIKKNVHAGPPAWTEYPHLTMS
jgi:hypothetical protein